MTIVDIEADLASIFAATGALNWFRNSRFGIIRRKHDGLVRKRRILSGGLMQLILGTAGFWAMPRYCPMHFPTAVAPFPLLGGSLKLAAKTARAGCTPDRRASPPDSGIIEHFKGTISIWRFIFYGLVTVIANALTSLHS